MAQERKRRRRETTTASSLVKLLRPTTFMRPVALFPSSFLFRTPSCCRREREREKVSPELQFRNYRLQFRKIKSNKRRTPFSIYLSRSVFSPSCTLGQQLNSFRSIDARFRADTHVRDVARSRTEGPALKIHPARQRSRMRHPFASSFFSLFPFFSRNFGERASERLRDGYGNRARSRALF